jgi:hypothetical protein
VICPNGKTQVMKNIPIEEGIYTNMTDFDMIPMGTVLRVTLDPIYAYPAYTYSYKMNATGLEVVPYSNHDTPFNGAVILCPL